ncbi:MAG TPA: hypothetical protein DCX07_13070 [Phycisphaerales bacterium]|nr:hypothetical protein [Phycisphaerales bacterium]
MTPDRRFLKQSKHFWANVRTISQRVGYTDRGAGQIKIPSPHEISVALSEIGLKPDHIVDTQGRLTDFGKSLTEYFQYRADVLNSYVEPRLQDAKEAKRLYRQVRGKKKFTCPIPMNKQKGSKKAPAFLTGIVNMIIETYASGLPCDFDPRELTTVTRNGAPLRTLARRVDGAFPKAVNPVAVWEIKEYYYTTTFGSRVADGVYETLLDGMELDELREHEGVDVKHYLIVDSHYTWWDCGRSYLCRLVDMLHMGYIDEVLFGREVVERLPSLVKEWLAMLAACDKRG